MGHIGQPASLCNSMVLVRARKCCVSLANRHYGQSFRVQWAEICWKSQQRYTPQLPEDRKEVQILWSALRSKSHFLYVMLSAIKFMMLDSMQLLIRSWFTCNRSNFAFAFWLLFCCCLGWVWKSNQAPLNLGWVWRSNQEFAWVGFWFDTYKNGSDQAHCHCTVL